jgi:hypothetical protein
MGQVWRSMVNLETENDMKAEFLRTSIGGWVFVAIRNLLGDSCLVAAALASGGDNVGEIHSPTLQGKNLKSGLSWLCLTMVLLKALFCERWLSPAWKPNVYDWMTTTLVHCFLLGGIAWSWISGDVLALLVLQLHELVTVAKLLFL